MSSEAGQLGSGPTRVADTPTFLATFAALLVAIALILPLDLFLARTDRRESEALAARNYAEGVELLANRHASEAAERFGAAVAVDRQNVRFSLALGEAMLAEGHVSDAEATLKAVLDRAENDGAVNLAMAHVMLHQGRDAEAKAYLHRAVFGRWGADSVARRTEARFELIHLLARTGAKRELLAELLPFEDTSPDSTDLRRRLGALFIAAGSPTRAADMYREVLRRDPTDADAYAGMGEAALAQGHFRTARADFAEAARLRPSDSTIASRLALADTVASLDPTASSLGAAEQYNRSRKLLERTLATLGVCLPSGAGAVADSARALLQARRSAARQGPAGDGMVIAASRLWAAGANACAPAAHDEALHILFTHLAQ